MTTEDRKTTDAPLARVPLFTREEFKGADQAVHCSLEVAVDALVELRRVVLMMGTNNLDPTLLDGVADVLGAAMLACKRYDDAQARYDEMCKEVEVCRATPIKAAA